MFQSEKKSSNPVNKNHENTRATADNRDYYSIVQEQNKALNSQNTPVQLKEDEEEEPLQAKTAPVQRMVEEEEEEMQMKHGGEESGTYLHSTPVFSKMNEAIQTKMENSFGTSFSNVNIIHNDPSAKHMGALAYTKGKDVHFAPGQYNPESQKGQELLGHELTHVVQQQQGRVSQTTQQKGVSVNDSPSLEQEADDMGKRAANGQSVNVVGKGSGVQKKEQTNVDNTQSESKYESYKSKSFKSVSETNILDVKEENGKITTSIVYQKEKRFDIDPEIIPKNLKVSVLNTDKSYEKSDKQFIYKDVVLIKVIDASNTTWHGRTLWTSKSNISTTPDTTGLYKVISGSANVRNGAKEIKGGIKKLPKDTEVMIIDFKYEKYGTYLKVINKDTKEVLGWINAGSLGTGLLNESFGLEKATYISEEKNRSTINRNGTKIYKISGKHYPIVKDSNKKNIRIEKGTKIEAFNEKDGYYCVNYFGVPGHPIGYLLKSHVKYLKDKGYHEVISSKAYLHAESRKFIDTGKTLNVGAFVVEKERNHDYPEERFAKVALTEEKNGKYSEKENSDIWVETDHLTSKWADPKGKNATWSEGVYTGQIDYVNTIGESGYMKYMKTDTKNPSNDMYSKFLEMANAAKASGIILEMASGFRDFPEQVRLRNRYLAGKTQIPAGAAGYSKHQIGIAVDLNNVKTSNGNNAINKWLMKNAYRFNFVKPLDMGEKEAHHWEHRPNEVRTPKQMEKKVGGKTTKYTRYYYATWSLNTDKEWNTYGWKANCYDVSN